MKINLMSMEQLDRVVRNPAAPLPIRRVCRTELAKRECQFGKRFVWAYDESLRKEREFFYEAPGL